jgi:hypothetical protein
VAVVAAAGFVLALTVLDPAAGQLREAPTAPEAPAVATADER